MATIVRTGPKRIGERQKHADFQLLADTDDTGFTDWLDVGPYPTSCVQVYAAAGGLSVNVQQSNVPHDDVVELVANVTVSGTIVALTKGAKYVRLQVVTNPGKCGAVWHGALQS